VAAQGITPIAAVTFEKDVKARIAENTGGITENTEVSIDPVPGTRQFFTTAEYDVRFTLPQLFRKKEKVCDMALARAFVGKRYKDEKTTAEELEKDEDAKEVWIFPRAGEKYHKEDCGVIKVNPRERIKSPQVTKNYKPCPNCNAAAAPNGSLVYCFPDYGRAYHIGSCPSVDRYVTKTTEEEAKEEGYSPCSKCKPQT
jgi:hypothetical protein